MGGGGQGGCGMGWDVMKDDLEDMGWGRMEWDALEDGMGWGTEGDRMGENGM